MRVHRLMPLIVVSLAATSCSATDPAGSTPPSPDASSAPSMASGPASPGESEDPGEPSAELPADLPVDVPDGGRVDGVFPPVAGTLQDGWVVRILYAPETADALVEFYDAWFADEGVEVEASRNDRVARWTERTDHPLQSVTINFADPFYQGNNRLEITYEADD